MFILVIKYQNGLTIILDYNYKHNCINDDKLDSLEIMQKYNILVDIPDRSRKFHKRATPLTGGIGILIALLVSGKLYIDLNNLTGYLPDLLFN